MVLLGAKSNPAIVFSCCEPLALQAFKKMRRTAKRRKAQDEMAKSQGIILEDNLKADRVMAK